MRKRTVSTVIVAWLILEFIGGPALLYFDAHVLLPRLQAAVAPIMSKMLQ